ncbi:MAG: peptidase T [Bacteroidales bacterium]|nr:peptidase T [Bacteroidales bacterium]
MIKDSLTERFLKYVSIDTQSDASSLHFPSTATQTEFARLLKKEMEKIGISSVNLDENGYLTGEIPSNSKKRLPSVGFIAHMDTSPDFSGKGVSPSIVKNYDGKPILLNEQEDIILSPEDFPELKKYTGQDLIVTDGTTLLGADDKAGIAEIMTAAEYLIGHPEIEHGRIGIAFTPDEEIGKGASRFNVKRFDCDWAYTMDGGETGELEFENFNAGEAIITFKGRNVHPGTAKSKMINAQHLAMAFAHLLPQNERPENTEGYEGFYHLISMSGDVEKATLHYIIRDHDTDTFELRKKYIEECASKINREYPGSTTLSIRDQYFNMKEKIAPVFHIIEIAKRAMLNCGITPVIKPIRGGTDGAILSFKGLPCPNIFAGGLNFHGKYEFVPIPSMEKACEVIISIAKEVVLTNQ